MRRLLRAIGMASVLVACLFAAAPIVAVDAPARVSESSNIAATFNYDDFSWDTTPPANARAAALCMYDADRELSQLSIGVSAGSTAAKEPTLRHYTTRRAGRAIEEDGQIVPGRSGKIWVTPDRYDSGGEAMKRLALNKEPEGFFEIPLSRLPGVTKPSRVGPANRQPGGGLECTVSCPVDVRGLPFRGIPR